MNSFAGNVPNPGPTNPLQIQSGANLTAAIPGVQQFQGLANNALPYAQSTFDQSYTNPYQNQAMAGAQSGAGYGDAAAGNIFDIGSTLAGQTLGGTLPYAQGIAQTAFDPQQQLYQRTLQQVQDQTRAGEAARGISTSPYGAGLENQALSNFNIDWQNQQLGRQAQGAGALSQLYGTALAGGAGGANLMGQAPGLAYGSAQLPYQTYQGFGQNQNQAIMNLLGYGAGAQNLYQTGVQDWLGALGAGTQQQQVANQNFQTSLNQANLGWNQMGGLASGLGALPYGKIFSGIGSGIGALGGLFGGAGSALGGADAGAAAGAMLAL